MLAAGFLAAALSAPGQTFFVSLYVPEIVEALGISLVSVSTVYGVATLAGAALLPLVGAWADRSSATRFLGMVVGGLGLSLLALAHAEGPVMLALAWTASRCLGQGAIGVGMLAALSRAFTQSRGRALAIGSLGHPFGEFVFPVGIATLLAFTTWRQSLLIFASLYLVFFAPLVAAGFRSVPRVIRAPPGPFPSGAPGHTETTGLRQALRMPVFWVATLLLTAAPVVVTALLFHQVAFFEGAGLSRGDVPVALMYFAAAQIGATIITGHMVDRGALRGPLALSCTALIGSTLCLGLPLPGSARVALYGAALGYATGAAAVAGAALWPAYFGVAAVGRIRAFTSGIRNAATAGAPLLLAVVIERSDVAMGQLLLVALGSLALVLTTSLPRSPRGVPRAHPAVPLSSEI